MADPDSADRDRFGQPWLMVPTHVALLVCNLLALTGGVHRLSVTEHPIWFERDHYAGAMNLEGLVAFARLCLIAMSPYLLLLFIRGDRRWPRLFILSGATCLMVEMLLVWFYNLWRFWIFDASLHFRWGVAGAALVAPALVLVVRSGELRSRFVSEPAVLAPWTRLTIGLTAALLISWPFTMMAHAEPTEWISAQLSPSNTTAGNPLAWAFVATSFGAGVLMLLKFTWQVSRGWTAFLLPLGYLSLSYAYLFMNFVSHSGR